MSRADDAKLAYTPCPKCHKVGLKFSGAGHFTYRKEYAVECPCGFTGWIGWTVSEDGVMAPDFSPACRELLPLKATPEFERGVRVTRLFDLSDVKITLFDKFANPVPPGTRTVACAMFEIEAEGINPRFVAKVLIGKSTGEHVAPLFVLDYSLAHELAMPSCFAVGHDGRLGTARDGNFKVEVISYVEKAGAGKAI